MNQPATRALGMISAGCWRKIHAFTVRVANMGYLSLRLQASVAFFCAEGVFYQFIAMDCINAVDYSIRPANPALLMGGPLIEYHEKHELLDNVSQSVPNTDDGQVFNPPIKFVLLNIDQSYVIAQRFDLTILNNGASTTIGPTLAQKQQKQEVLKRALESMDKYRLLPRRTNSGPSSG
jgi:hypothetical protein